MSPASEPREKTATRRCTACGEFKPLDPDNFGHRSEPERASEFLSKCIPCYRQYKARVMHIRRAPNGQQLENEPRPKICRLCCNLPDRVEGAACKLCGLPFAPDNIPTVFGRLSKPVLFVVPPEEMVRKCGGNQSTSLVDGAVVNGWQITMLLRLHVNVRHLACGKEKTFTKKHLRQARSGYVEMYCATCAPRTRGAAKRPPNAYCPHHRLYQHCGPCSGFNVASRRIGAANK